MVLWRAGAVLLLCGTSLYASPVKLPKASVRAEDQLRVWLDQEPAIRAKLGLVQAQATAVPAVFAEPDLKDAVRDSGAPDPERSRRELLARLPGLQASSVPVCRDLAGCSAPLLSQDVAAGEPLEPAIRALLRPWLLLAEAQGRRISVTPAVGPESQRILTVNLAAGGRSGVGLNAQARPAGGVHLWFDQALELAEAYSRQRAALLPR